MSKQERKPLVPALRFPEFHNEPEWAIKPMDKLFTIGNGKDHKHLQDGDIPVYGSGGYMRSADEYLYDGESACIGRKGTIDKPIFLTGKFWTVDTLFYTHSFKNCLPKFVFLIFQNINWRSHNEAGGIPSLSKANINKIEVACPKPAEQQKIVDFISSVDELIIAEAQKVEALKNHKKGLMQQLFPSEGELVPKLRFPEFQGKGNWRELSLIDAAEFIDSLHETPKQYIESGYPMIRVADIKDTGLDLNACLKVTEGVYLHFIKRYKPQLGDIIFSRVGTCGESVLIDFEKDVCLGQNTLLLKPKENYQFLFWYMKSNLIKGQVDRKVVGSSHKTLSIKDTKKFDVYLPCKNEQQKIADFLSSLDELITAQAQKVKILKAYKKGLMQQLFPSADKVKHG